MIYYLLDTMSPSLHM